MSGEVYDLFFRTENLQVALSQKEEDFLWRAAHRAGFASVDEWARAVLAREVRRLEAIRKEEQ